MLITQIQNVISRCGPRPAGSPAEMHAQQLLCDRLKGSTSAVSLEEFQAPLNAKFMKMKLCAVLFFCCLALYWFSPITALILAVFNAAVVLCDLMRNDGIADFLFPKQTSWNVSATLEPQQEVKQTLIFSGHIDSSHECQWWYKWKRYGIYLTVISGVIIVALPLFLLFFIWSENYWPAVLPATGWFYAFFLLLSPSLLVYLNFHNEIVVEGACDNLSGTIIALNAFEQLRDPLNAEKNILKNTRIRFLSFGSEERGLRGSSAYVKAHREELKNENAHLINIDSVRLENQVTFVTGEWMSGAFYNKKMLSLLERVFNENRFFYKKGNLPLGATDAVSFAQQGFPALTIIGMDMGNLDPTYHTRLDTADNVEEKALQNVVAGLVGFAKIFQSP